MSAAEHGVDRHHHEGMRTQDGAGPLPRGAARDPLFPDTAFVKTTAHGQVLREGLQEAAWSEIDRTHGEKAWRARLEHVHPGEAEPLPVAALRDCWDCTDGTIPWPAPVAPEELDPLDREVDFAGHPGGSSSRGRVSGPNHRERRRPDEEAARLPTGLLPQGQPTRTSSPARSPAAIATAA